MPATTDPANLAGLQGVRRPRHRPGPGRRSPAPRNASSRSPVPPGAPSRSGTTCDPLLRHGRRLRRGGRRGRADVVLIGLASTDQLYFASGGSASPARCSPRATTPRSTTGSRCAAPTRCPSACRPGCRDPRPGRRGRAPWPRDGDGLGVRRAGRLPAHLPGRCTAGGRPWSARQRMAGRTLRRLREARRRPGADVLRARRQLPEPRGEPDRARRTCATCRRGVRGDAPTSAWRSTATPTAASSSTSAASWSAPRSSPR